MLRTYILMYRCKISLQKMCHGCLQVWGLDPGFREVFVACNVTKYDKQENLHSTVRRYSAEQYYHDAHINSGQKQIKRWQQGDAAYMAIVASPNTPSAKTRCPDKLRVRPVDLQL